LPLLLWRLVASKPAAVQNAGGFAFWLVVKIRADIRGNGSERTRGPRL
jgi:hypothetical protein